MQAYWVHETINNNFLATKWIPCILMETCSLWKPTFCWCLSTIGKMASQHQKSPRWLFLNLIVTESTVQRSYHRLNSFFSIYTVLHSITLPRVLLVMLIAQDCTNKFFYTNGQFGFSEDGGTNGGEILFWILGNHRTLKTKVNGIELPEDEAAINLLPPVDILLVGLSWDRLIKCSWCSYHSMLLSVRIRTLSSGFFW